jgi:S1-C subfamily serine protease
MGLPETFEAVRPSIIAFVSRVIFANAGEQPLFPEIIGTGFFVHESGIAATNRHVIDQLEKLNSRFPQHPTTGASATGAFVFTDIKSSETDQVLGVLNVDVLGWKALEEFSSSAPWFGQAVPDLGFVQLKVRDVPVLPLAAEANTLRVGISIATAGFPEGTRTVTFHKKITQLTPVLRHGIISSVFPFGGPNPHGFSIDTLLQGGASGSPVFKTDEPRVVGMIASRIPDTNYTVAVPAHLLAGALAASLAKWPTFPDVPTLPNLIESGEASGNETLNWDEYQILRPSPSA